MKVKRKLGIITLCAALILNNLVLSPSVMAADGDHQRQSVLQRTMQYAQGVDLVKVNRQVRSDYVPPRDHGSGNVSLEGKEQKCEGYTTSECGLSCCGKAECESICNKNQSIAHGDEMCLSDIQTSECGMSCCGAEDCANVCLNYRISGDCGGYTQTEDGKACCGYEDCRAKACGAYTSVTTASGVKATCCGKENCEKVRCEYQLKTTGQYGGPVGQACCGRDDCYSKECQGLTSVDSRVDPQKKNLKCCGEENCRLTACDGYVSVQTPEGLAECCGYADCHNKECGGYTEVVDVSGNLISCCGKRNCESMRCQEQESAFGQACCGYEECSSKNLTLSFYQNKGCKNCNWSLEPTYWTFDMPYLAEAKVVYVSGTVDDDGTFTINGKKSMYSPYHGSVGVAIKGDELKEIFKVKGNSITGNMHGNGKGGSYASLNLTLYNTDSDFGGMDDISYISLFTTVTGDQTAINSYSQYKNKVVVELRGGFFRAGTKFSLLGEDGKPFAQMELSQQKGYNPYNVDFYVGPNPPNVVWAVDVGQRSIGDLKLLIERKNKNGTFTPKYYYPESTTSGGKVNGNSYTLYGYEFK